MQKVRFLSGVVCEGCGVERSRGGLVVDSKKGLGRRDGVRREGIGWKRSVNLDLDGVLQSSA
jgi:hypothetical protein